MPFKAMLGQWGHAWPQATSKDARCTPDASGVADCRTDWWEQVLVAWFDQFLKGMDTGILDAPAVQVQDDDGLWRHEQAWPPADVAWQVLRPADGGRLVGEGEAPPTTVAWVDGSGAMDLVPRSARAQPVGYPMFRSEPLAEDVRVSGQPVFVGNITAQGPRASVLLTLAEELPNGVLRPFNYAAQSLNHVGSLESGTPSVAGLRQQVEVRFFPQDDVVHAGNRLVLVVGGAFLPGGPGPALQPVAAGGLVQFETQGSQLRLPLDTGIVLETPQPHE